MCLQLLACLCPPLALCVHKGPCSCEWLVALFLTCLGWIPGCIYACAVVSQSTPQTTVIVKNENKNVVNCQPQAASPPTNVVINMPGPHPGQQPGGYMMQQQQQYYPQQMPMPGTHTQMGGMGDAPPPPAYTPTAPTDIPYPKKF